jgi:replicative DNA helicase
MQRATDEKEARVRRRLEAAGGTVPRPTWRAEDGASFVLGEPDRVPAVWGDGQAVLWSEGEALWIVGPQGVGKTTLAGQLALRRAGVIDGPLLGMTVAADERRVLYVAADRPRQAARSLRRMVGLEHEDRLRERLAVWRGPLPFDLLADPSQLAALADQQGAGTLVIDSAKDVAAGLAKDEVGAAVNIAMQHVVAAGIELVVLHHQRKAQADNKAPRSLDDVYGSTFLTAAAGSVALLWGDAGDPVVELRHLKQPAEDVGPLKIVHDHRRGATGLHEPVDLPALLDQAAGDGGLTAADAARALYGVTGPSPSVKEKARRKLDGMVEAGLATEVSGRKGGAATRWLPADQGSRA